MSIYLSTHAGNLLRGCTSAQVGLGHEPLKRSVPFYSDNRAGIITDLAGSDSPYRVFKTQLIIPRCKMAFSMGERGRNERDTFHKQVHLLFTHTTQARNHARMYKQANRSNTTEYVYAMMYRHLDRSTYGHDTTACTQKQKERPPHRHGGRQGPWTFMFVGLG